MQTQHDSEEPYGSGPFPWGRKSGRWHHRDKGFGPFGHGPGHGPFGPGFRPGPGRDFWRFFGGPHAGHRMRRGDVRLAILALLKESARNGYGIIQEIESRSGGMWKPSAGAVYPALQQLEDEGLIEQFDNAGRREFRLTEAGASYVAEHADEIGSPWEAASGEPSEGLFGLMGLVRQVGIATMQVSQAGTPAQTARAKEILEEARRSLYGILAEKDETAV